MPDNTITAVYHHPSIPTYWIIEVGDRLFRIPDSSIFTGAYALTAPYTGSRKPLMLAIPQEHLLRCANAARQKVDSQRVTRSDRILVRVSAAEKSAIRAAADQTGCSVGEYIRRRCLP